MIPLNCQGFRGTVTRFQVSPWSHRSDLNRWNMCSHTLYPVRIPASKSCLSSLFPPSPSHFNLLCSHWLLGTDDTLCWHLHQEETISLQATSGPPSSALWLQVQHPPRAWEGERISKSKMIFACIHLNGSLSAWLQGYTVIPVTAAKKNIAAVACAHSWPLPLQLKEVVVEGQQNRQNYIYWLRMSWTSPPVRFASELVNSLKMCLST